MERIPVPVMGTYAINSNIVLVGLFEGMLRTTDGGITWDYVRFPSQTGSIFQIDYKDEIAYFISNLGFYHSYDSGATWQKIWNNGGSRFSVIDSLNIWITSAGSIWHTSDGGKRFENHGIYLANSISMFEDIGIAVGSDKVYYTSNGGTDWLNGQINLYYPLYNSILQCIIIKKENNLIGYLSSSWNDANLHLLYKTIDSGKTWHREDISLSGPVEEFTYKDGVIWARTRFTGDIYKNQLIEPNGLYSENYKIADYHLFQNYPNPFNPSTRIKYTIPQRDMVTIKIYDLIGKEVKTLVNEIKDKGEYETLFEASSLSSGMYFYTLKTSSFFETRKMMFIK